MSNRFQTSTKSGLSISQDAYAKCQLPIRIVKGLPKMSYKFFVEDVARGSFKSILIWLGNRHITVRVGSTVSIQLRNVMDMVLEI